MTTAIDTITEDFLDYIAEEDRYALLPDEELSWLLDGHSAVAYRAHELFYQREVCQELLSSIITRHPRLVREHQSTSAEMRDLFVTDDALRARWNASPSVAISNDCCGSCALFSTRARLDGN